MGGVGASVDADAIAVQLPRRATAGLALPSHRAGTAAAGRGGGSTDACVRAVTSARIAVGDAALGDEGNRARIPAAAANLKERGSDEHAAKQARSFFHGSADGRAPWDKSANPDEEPPPSVGRCGCYF
jgi:hypothetical protein